MAVREFLLEREILERREEGAPEALVQGHLAGFGTARNSVTRALNQSHARAFKKREELVKLFGRVLAVAMQAGDILRAGLEACGNPAFDNRTVTRVLFKAFVMQAARDFIVRNVYTARGFNARDLTTRDKRLERPARFILRAVVNHEHFRTSHDRRRNAPQHVRKSLRNVVCRNKNKIV